MDTSLYFSYPVIRLNINFILFIEMRNHIITAICVIIIILTLIKRNSFYDLGNTSSYEEVVSVNASHNKQEIELYYHNKRPYFIKDNTEVKGLMAEPVNLIFTQADISFKWIEIPARRQLELLSKNDYPGCAAGLLKTTERESFGKFTKPIYRDKPFVALSRIENTLIFKEDSLERVFKEGRLRLLIKSGYSYGNVIDSTIRQFKPWIITTTADNIGMLKMIETHRADYFFLTEEEAYDLLLFSGVNRSKFKTIFFNNTPQGDYRYLLCSKKVEDHYISDLNLAIDHFLNISEETE